MVGLGGGVTGLGERGDVGLGGGVTGFGAVAEFEGKAVADAGRMPVIGGIGIGFGIEAGLLLSGIGIERAPVKGGTGIGLGIVTGLAPDGIERGAAGLA